MTTRDSARTTSTRVTGWAATRVSTEPRRRRALRGGWAGSAASVVAPLLRVGPRLEVERRGVDAVAQPGRPWAVGEEVAKVGAAVRAHDLGSRHAQREVALLGYAALLDDVVERRPAGARIELRARVEQRLVAHHAAVGALGVVIPVDATERPLGMCFLGDRILDRRQARAECLRVNRLHAHSWPLM